MRIISVVLSFTMIHLSFCSPILTKITKRTSGFLHSTYRGSSPRR